MSSFKEQKHQYEIDDESCNSETKYDQALNKFMQMKDRDHRVDTKYG